MLRRLALLLFTILGLSPVKAEEPNLATDAADQGAATQLVLAQRLYSQASASGDPVLLLAAIRLARGITTRPAPGWERLTDPATPPVPAPERQTPADPASDAALTVLQGLASDDPDLLDLAYDLGAQLPQGRLPVATVVQAGLTSGTQDSWRVPLSGGVAAEIALIGDGGGPVGLTVTDEAGNVICTRPPATDPCLCRFTPARNGFFTLQVTNAGAGWNSYRLVGN
ncbi:MAG TPA: hypothetical protein VI412_06900 [Tabrizicola sp.]